MIELSNINGAWLALFGAIFGGIGIKLFESVILPRATKVDIATEIRDELRKEIKDLKEDCLRMENDLDKWKLKYYDLLDKYSVITAKYNDLKDDLKGVRTDVDNKVDK